MSKEGSAYSNFINIVVSQLGGCLLYFRVSRKVRLKRLMDKYCDCVRVSRSEVAFVYARSKTNDEDTAESLNMQERDVIQVYKKSELVRIKVIHSERDIIRFRIHRTNKLKKLMDTYRQGSNVPHSQGCFLYHGSRINEEDTPASLNMQKSATIKFYPAQQG